MTLSIYIFQDNLTHIFPRRRKYVFYDLFNVCYLSDVADLYFGYKSAVEMYKSSIIYGVPIEPLMSEDAIDIIFANG